MNLSRLILGLLGLLAFIYLIGSYLTKAWSLVKVAKDKRWLAIAMLASMVAVLVHGLVDVPYFSFLEIATTSTFNMSASIRSFISPSIFSI